MSVKNFPPRIQAILRKDLPQLSKEHLALSTKVYYATMTDAQIQDFENSVDARRNIERKIEVAYEAMGTTLLDVGALLENATIANYVSKTLEQQKAVATAIKYADNACLALENGINLIFFGTVGTGKDHLMMGVAKKLFNARKTVAWTNGPQLKTRMRDCINGNDSEMELNRDCLKPDFLWISDLVVAGHPLTPYQSDCVYQIVEARSAQKKPILMTINVKNPFEFNTSLGAATADRLRNKAICHFFDWESYRVPSSEDVFDKLKSFPTQDAISVFPTFVDEEYGDNKLFPPIAPFTRKSDLDQYAKLRQRREMRTETNGYDRLILLHQR